MMRAPLAPRASRTLISRCRLMARSSSRLATLTQAISSTKATAPSNSSSVGRRLPTIDSCSGLTPMPRSLFSSGNCAASPAAITPPSDCACSTVTPGFSRPIARQPR